MYTHLGQGIDVLRDPPKSPLKKGDFESGSPFFKGDWGGSNPVEARSEDLCVHGSPGERDFESFSGSPRPLGEGLGVRAKTTVLNMDLVYVSFSWTNTAPRRTLASLP